jgi:DNA-binding CsgD family transcriptional regulator
MDDTKRAYKILLFFSSAFAVLVGIDLVTDFVSGGSGSHLVVEGLLLAICAGFFIFGVKQLQEAKTEIITLKKDMDQLTLEKEKWKQDSQRLLEGLSYKIESQFSDWKLTPAEQEVGFFLIKGFSLKEISALRDTKIKTTQQQAQSIYQKSGLSNRSELSAFFLEDLLPPQ